MPIVFPAFVNGTVMSPAAVQTELDRMRNFVNGRAGSGLVVADVPVGSLERDHFARPVITEIVKGAVRFHGPVQRLAGVNSGIGYGSPAGLGRNGDVNREWAKIRERESIFVGPDDTGNFHGTLPLDGIVAIPALGARMFLGQDVHAVEITCSFDAQWSYDNVAGVVRQYPDAAGTGGRAGWFSIGRHVGGTFTDLGAIGGPRCFIYPNRWDPAAPATDGSWVGTQAYEMSWAEPITAGTGGTGMYDYFVFYNAAKGLASEPDITLRQLMISRRNFVFEVHGA